MLLAIPLHDPGALPSAGLARELGPCPICERALASVLVVDDQLSPILGDDTVGAEFAVCERCAEIVAQPAGVPVAARS